MSVYHKMYFFIILCKKCSKHNVNTGKQRFCLFISLFAFYLRNQTQIHLAVDRRKSLWWRRATDGLVAKHKYCCEFSDVWKSKFASHRYGIIFCFTDCRIKCKEFVGCNSFVFVHCLFLYWLATVLSVLYRQTITYVQVTI